MFTQTNYKKFLLIFKVVCTVLFGILAYALVRHTTGINNPSSTLRRGIVVDSAYTFKIDSQYSNASQTFLHEMFEGLVRAHQDGSIEPAVAKKWTTKEEKIWLFDLDSRYQWSDGTPVIALDFVEGFYRLFLNAKKNKKLSEDLKNFCHIFLPILNFEKILQGEMSVETLGISEKSRYQLEIRLKNSRRSSLVLYGLTNAYFFPQAAHEKNIFATEPKDWIVNGAFMLDNQEHKSSKIGVKNFSWVFKKNPHYCEFKKIKLTRIIYCFFESELDCQKAWKNSQIDLFGATAVTASISDFYPYLWATGKDSIWEMTANWKDPILKNREIRELVSKIFSREIIANACLVPGTTPQYSIVKISERIGSFFPKWCYFSAKDLQENVNKELKKKGYSKKNPLTLKILYTKAPSNFLKICENFETAHEAICFKLTKISNQELSNSLKTGDFQLYLHKNSAKPLPFLNYEAFLRNSEKNYGQCEKILTQEIFDDFISKSASIPYDARIYQDLELKFLRLWPTIPLIAEPNYFVACLQLQGMPRFSKNSSALLSSRSLYFLKKEKSCAFLNQRMDKFCKDKKDSCLEEAAYLFFW